MNRLPQDNSSSPYSSQAPSSTLIHRTLVEHGIRPVANKDNIYENGLSTLPAMITKKTKQHANEQLELQNLNLKLAAYLDHVQNLENYSGQLLAELEELKEGWGKESEKLNRTHGPELQLLRDGIDNVLRNQIYQDLETQRHKFDIKEMQQRIAVFDDYNTERLKLAQQNLNKSAMDLERIKNQCDRCTADVDKRRKNLENLYNEFDALQVELVNHRLERMMVENELQTLREQAAFQKATYLAQREEIVSLGRPAYDGSEFYRNELAHAIASIRHDFETLAETQAKELEEYYRVKTEEIEEIARENERQRLSTLETKETETSADPGDLSDINDDYKELKELNKQLRLEVEETLDDLERIQTEHMREHEKIDQELGQIKQELADKRTDIDNILENNISLRCELITYRSLLNSEEKRLGLLSQQEQQPAEILSAKPDQNQDHRNQDLTNQDTNNSGTQTMAVTKVAKGPIVFDSVDLINDCIMIQHERYGGQQESLENWTIRRQNDDQAEKVFQFPPSFFLKPRQKVTIFSKRSSVPAGRDNTLIADQIDTWGRGQIMVTTLSNSNNEEKARITQTIKKT